CESRLRREGYLAEKKDLPQIFIERKDDEGESLSDDIILDNIITLSITGRDTTALPLTWMFYLLLRDCTDKDIMSKLVHEVDEVLEGSDPTMIENQPKILFILSSFR
ncbi:Protein kinase alk2, partial [Mortierella sp. AD094]